LIYIGIVRVPSGMPLKVKFSSPGVGTIDVNFRCFGFN